MIPIVMITDANFVMQTCVALCSMKMNKLGSTVYDIYVIAVEDLKDEARQIEALSEEDFVIHIIQGSLAKYKEIKQMAHVPLASLVKFDICDLVPQYDKLLYLDGDIVVRQDLKRLYETELKDNYVAGVAHSIGVIANERKLNGGVLLFNAVKIREERLREVFVAKRLSLGNRKSMDQETFHIVFGEKKVYLHPQYNVMLDKVEYEKKYYPICDYNAYYGTAYKTRKEIIDTAVIIHFTGAIKPWKYRFAQCGKEWRKYYNCVFEDTRELELRNRITYWKEQIKVNGFRGMYWLAKDKVLAALGEHFNIFPDKSRGVWN